MALDLYELFKSVEIIADSKVQALSSSIDRTIVCTIINADKKDYGEYICQYEGLKITAHSGDPTYEVNDLVYVGVPANDYSNAFIIAKKIEEASLIDVADPFEGYIQMMKETDAGANAERNLITFSDPVEIFSKSFNDNLERYTTLGVQLKLVSGFTTAPSDSEYGFLVYVRTKVAVKNSNEAIFRTHPFILSSREMIGNAFGFIGESIQKKIIDISDLENIDMIKIYAFTSFSANAKLSANDYVKVLETQVSLGYTLSDGLDESLYLYSTEALEYNMSTDTAKTIPLLLRWLYKDGDVIKAVTFNNTTDKPTNATIRWERFLNNEWQLIPNYENLFKVSIDDLDRFKQTEQFRCSVLYESFDTTAPIEYTSNVVVIKNLEEGASNIIIDKTVKVDTDIKDYSVYYAPDGTIIDIGETALARQAVFQASMQNITLDSSINIVLNWHFYKNSMIKPFGFGETEEDKLSYEDATTSLEDKYIFSETLVAGGVFITPDDIINGQIKKSFYYTIDEFYSPVIQANKVTCEIVVKRITADKDEILQIDTVDLLFDFKRNGICKADKIMQLSMFDSNKDRVRAIIPGKTVVVQAKIYDCNGTEIALSQDIEWGWVCRPNRYSAEEVEIWEDGVFNVKDTVANQPMFTANKIDKNSCLITAPEINETQKQLDWCYILYAGYKETNAQGKVVTNVIGQLPIAINFQSSILKCLSGPTSIFYNSAGGEPQFYNSRYALFKSGNTEQNNTRWQIVVKGALEAATTVYPVIVEVDGHYYLSPKSTYTKNADKHCSVLGYYGTTLLWVQPILIAQTNSFSSYLKEWDGSFQMDEAGNTMMAARLGAGIKNPEDNTFSGVILGDWTEQTEDGSITMTGVYGLDHDLQAYALKEDGTAFFGKAGDGRINFNGNMGLIYSGNFDGKFYEAKTVFDATKTLYDLGIQDNLLRNSSDPYNSPNTLDLNISEIKLENDNLITIKGPMAYGSSQANGTDFYFQIPVKKLEHFDNDTPLLFETCLTINSFSYNPSDTAGKNGQILFDASQYMHQAYIDTNMLNTTLISINNKDQTNEDTKIDELPLYYGTKIALKWIIDPKGITINDSSILYIPMLSLKGRDSSSSNNTVGRDYDFCFSNTKLSVLSSTEQKSIDTIEKNRNVNKIVMANEGKQGTFINLKDGAFVTNGGIFRGSLQVESMTLLNDLVVGDASGQDDAPWTRIGRDGTFMANEVSINSMKLLGRTFLSKCSYTLGGSTSSYVALGYGSYESGFPVEGGNAGSVLYSSDGSSLCSLPALHSNSGPEASCCAYLAYSSSERVYQLLSGAWLCTDGLYSVSDERLKNNINVIDEKYNIFFDHLIPLEYKYDKEARADERLHLGFGANNVIYAAKQSNLPIEDMALVQVNATSPLPNTQEASFALNYTEFIALNTAQIQQLKKKVSELEAIISTLRDKIQRDKGDEN